MTFECNHPLDARAGREIVVGGMDTKHLTPLEIDELVRRRLAAGDELYRLDEDALSRCDPDLILSQAEWPPGQAGHTRARNVQGNSDVPTTQRLGHNILDTLQ